MLNISNIIDTIDGNGYSNEEVLQISVDLTAYVELRNKIANNMKRAFSNKQVEEILLHIDSPTQQQIIVSERYKKLSEREKECYSKHYFNGRSIGDIANELGVTRSTVFTYITRAREKLKIA